MNVRPIDANALHAEISKWPESVMYKDWVQSAIANAPTLTPSSEWVSVEERLPEFPGFLDHIMVITCDKNGYVMPMVRERTLVGYEWTERWLFPWNEIYVGPEITHWMQLPKPPKEEKEELKDASN